MNIKILYNIKITSFFLKVHNIPQEISFFVMDLAYLHLPVQKFITFENLIFNYPLLCSDIQLMTK